MLSERWSRLFIQDQDPVFLPIPDFGIKKAPDPGSGSATLLSPNPMMELTWCRGAAPSPGSWCWRGLDYTWDISRAPPLRPSSWHWGLWRCAPLFVFQNNPRAVASSWPEKQNVGTEEEVQCCGSWSIQFGRLDPDLDPGIGNTDPDRGGIKWPKKVKKIQVLKC